MRKLPKVNSTYGAPMGRVNRDITNAGPVRMHLQKVRLDMGGYDEGGAYWGIRSTWKSLYWYWWSGNIVKVPDERPLVISGFLDAENREDAKRQIKTLYPDVTFYR